LYVVPWRRPLVQQSLKFWLSAVVQIDASSPTGREELFVPYMFGAKGSSPNFAWGDPLPEVKGVHGTGDQNGDEGELAWMPNGWTRTMSWAAWLTTASGTRLPRSLQKSPSPAGQLTPPPPPSDGRAEVGLYLGVHDPNSRLKMLPAAPSGGGQASLRAVHVPASFSDASTDKFTVP
jgi:hypothetical protein